MFVVLESHLADYCLLSEEHQVEEKEGLKGEKEREAQHTLQANGQEQVIDAILVCGESKEECQKSSIIKGDYYAHDDNTSALKLIAQCYSDSDEA